jgi:hypothetical protein
MPSGGHVALGANGARGLERPFIQKQCRGDFCLFRSGLVKVISTADDTSRVEASKPGGLVGGTGINLATTDTGGECTAMERTTPALPERRANLATREPIRT